MPNANWIITFDDGPLPADVVDFPPNDADRLLDPLTSILDTLRTHPDGPVQAVFFLRGPGYPWRSDNKPPKALFDRGIDMMLQDNHQLALHCYTHDPLLWWSWFVTGPRIEQDMDDCVTYFTPMAHGHALSLFRPPYGQGGLPAWIWASSRGRRLRLWDIGSDDWLHHPDSVPFAQYQNDPGAHRDHVLTTLRLAIAWHTPGQTGSDLLLHVSVRTAQHLGAMLDTISTATRAKGLDPTYGVPPDYMRA